MSIEDKFNAVLALLQEHNDAVGSSASIDAQKFIEKIKLSGGTTDDRLKRLSYEDILDCLPNSEVKPKLLAKDIANVFRGSEDASKSSSEDKGRPVSAKKADRMTPAELVAAYDPEEPDSPVGKRLNSISRGEPFIVFQTGRIVDTDSTLKLLLEVKQGFEGRENYEVNGDIKKVHSVGELPDSYAEENPLYPDRPLRPDGTCDQLNRSWAGIPNEVRQFVRVALNEKEISVHGDGGRDRAHDLLDMCLEKDALKKLRRRYRNSAIRFDELAKTGSLPLLLVPLGVEEKKGVGQPRRPFGADAKKVEWVRSPDNTYKNLADQESYRQALVQYANKIAVPMKKWK